MEAPNTWTIIILCINIMLMLIAFFGGKVLSGIQETARETKEDVKRLFDKLEDYQSKDGCKTAHENHNKIHDLERLQVEKENERLQKDINNIAAMTRARVGA